MGRSRGREEYEARMKGVDAATKLKMMMYSPYTKHRKAAMAFEKRMQAAIKAVKTVEGSDAEGAVPVEVGS